MCVSHVLLNRPIDHRSFRLSRPEIPLPRPLPVFRSILVYRLPVPDL